jgi:hypothetical protein
VEACHLGRQPPEPVVRPQADHHDILALPQNPVDAAETSGAGVAAHPRVDHLHPDLAFGEKTAQPGGECLLFLQAQPGGETVAEKDDPRKNGLLSSVPALDCAEPWPAPFLARRG